MSASAPQNGLSRSARTGLIGMLVIIAVLFIFWRMLPLFFQGNIPVEDQQLAVAWEQFKQNNTIPVEKRPAPPQAVAGKTNKTHSPNAAVAVSLFPFDPNTASENEFVRLGLSPAVAQTIVRYRGKGGQFRNPEDFQKIYTLKPADYKRLAPYIRIDAAHSSAAESRREVSQPVPEPVSVSLNAATVDELIRLKGIGPVYAGRIIKFRDKLGGFYETAQLREVYGFPDSTYRLLKDYFIADISSIRKININKASAEALAQHPYIGKKMAENIVKLRNDLCQFHEITELQQVPLINAEKYRKIAPYLKLTD